MAFAEERQQMMFAQAVEFDVPDNDHVILFRCKYRAVNDIFQVLLVSARQIVQAFFHPFRRFDQTFPFRVVTQFQYDFFDFFLHHVLLFYIHYHEKVIYTQIEEKQSRFVKKPAIRFRSLLFFCISDWKKTILMLV